MFTRNHFRKHLSFWATFLFFLSLSSFPSHGRVKMCVYSFDLGSYPLRFDDISCQLNAGNLIISTQNASKHPAHLPFFS